MTIMDKLKLCVSVKLFLILERMDRVEFGLICGPISFSGAVLNVFFIFGLLKPHGVERERLCRILKFLLIFISFNGLCQQMACLFASFYSIFLFGGPSENLLMANIIYASISANLSSIAWLSVFYYISIIPHKHAVITWIKRNFRHFIYYGVAFDRIFLLFSLFADKSDAIFRGTHNLNVTAVQSNITKSNDNQNVLPAGYLLSCVTYSIYLMVSCSTMTFSWGKLYIYLNKHMKRMEDNQGPFSHPQQQIHMRVAITGLVQTALYLPSCLWMLIIIFVFHINAYQSGDPEQRIQWTLLCLLALCSSLCLGFSQSVFRHQFESLYQHVTSNFLLR